MRRRSWRKRLRDFMREEGPEMRRQYGDGWRYVTETIAVQSAVRAHEQRLEGVIENWFPNLDALFVHIPKTAGTSVHRILSAADAAAPSRPNAPPGGRGPCGKHLKPNAWRARLGAEVYERAFSFCFVRNPWDLMVSSYFWWCQHATKFRDIRRQALVVRRRSFDDFIHSDYGRYYINELHGPCMSEWYAANGRDQVDFIARVEYFDTDMSHVLDRLGVAHAQRPEFSVTNTTQRADYRDYYSDSGRAIVAERFADTIERFGYRF